MENKEEIYAYQISDINDLEGEIWKDVEGFEDCYKISNYGRIKSLERIIKTWHGYRTIKEKMLKQSINMYGYLQVNLVNAAKGIDKCFRVNRLVAQAFLNDYSEELQVNHINEIKVDNRVENLNMMTPKENNSWGTKIERVAKSKRKQVGQFSLDGKIIMIFPSTQEAESKGFSHSSISRCCNGIQKQHHGFQWRYI